MLCKRYRGGRTRETGRKEWPLEGTPVTAITAVRSVCYIILGIAKTENALVLTCGRGRRHCEPLYGHSLLPGLVCRRR